MKNVLIETVLCPTGINSNELSAKTAINSIALVTGMTWEESVKSLIEQACLRSNMPCYPTCVTDMLRVNGMKPMKNEYLKVSEFLFELNCSNDKTAKYIINLGYAGYFAVCFDDVYNRFLLKGTMKYSHKLENCTIEKIWEYDLGTDNRTGINRTSKKRRHIDNKERLLIKNENSKDKNIGDCVVRAISAVYDCSWEKAVDLLAKANGYCDPVINTTKNIALTLTMLGFKKYHTIKIGNDAITGDQFCNVMDNKFTNGEKIYAFSGKHHAVAILPTYKDGKYFYKIQDTWDSSRREIYEYWVYGDKSIEASPTLSQKEKINSLSKQEDTNEVKLENYQINSIVVHKKFGEGVVKNITGSEKNRVLEIDFKHEGIKKISESWLNKS